MKLFTLVDYAAFGLWILISILLSYLLVRKLNLFEGGSKNQRILAIGLIADAPPNLNIFMYLI